MHHEFTAILEPPDETDRYWIAYCPEVPGANGQGESEDQAMQSLRDAIKLILEERRDQGLQGLPEHAIQAVVIVA